MKRILKVVFFLAVLLPCMMSCSKIKVDPSYIVVDSSKQTVELKVNREIRMYDVSAGIVTVLSGPEYYDHIIENDYYEDEGELNVSRHIVGEWCHVEGDMFTDVILVHLDENTSSESRGIAIHVDSGKGDVRCSVIIQEGKK